MTGRAAFLLPAGRMVPLRGRPPVTRKRGMGEQSGALHAKSSSTTRHRNQRGIEVPFWTRPTRQFGEISNIGEQDMPEKEQPGWPDSLLNTVQSNHLETGKRVSRLLLISILGSILLIAFALGVIQVNSSVSVSGLSMTIDHRLAEIAGTYLLTFIWLQCMSLGNHELRLYQAVERQYKARGCDLADLGGPELSLLEFPNLITGLAALKPASTSLPSIHRAFYFVSVFVAILLPLAAHLVVLYRVWVDYSWSSAWLLPGVVATLYFTWGFISGESDRLLESGNANS